MANFSNKGSKIQFSYHSDSRNLAVSHMKRETTRRVGAAIRFFYQNAPFFHDGGYKTNVIIKSFSKETKKFY